MTTRAPGGARHRRSSADARDARPITDPGHQADARADQHADARRDDKFLQGVYDDGRRDGKREAKSSTKRQSSRRPRATGAPARARRTVQRAARATTSPAYGLLYTGTRLFGTGLLLVALYLVVTNAPTVSVVLDGLTRGVRWVRSPNTSIPFKTEK